MKRESSIERKTKETDIKLKLSLDGSGKAHIQTGIGFFDHMLSAFAVHGRFDLDVTVQGDLDVDTHHTIEDTGIVLGKALKKILGDRSGIRRFGNFSVPMDEALAFCAVDISGRAFTVFEAHFANPFIGSLETECIKEFWRAFAENAGITLHLICRYGENDHHKCEALFKACAHALREASREGENEEVLSSKGV